MKNPDMLFIPKEDLNSFARYIVTSNDLFIHEEDTPEIIRMFKQSFKDNYSEELILDTDNVERYIKGFLIKSEDVSSFFEQCLSHFLSKRLLECSNEGLIEIGLDQKGEFCYNLTNKGILEGKSLLKSLINKGNKKRPRKKS